MLIVHKDLAWTITAQGTQRREMEREGKLNPLQRVSVGLLAALIAVGPGGAVGAVKVTDDASLLSNESNPDLVGGSFTQPLELQHLHVIFAPTDAEPDTIRRLGPEPRLRSPVIAAGIVDVCAGGDYLDGADLVGRVAWNTSARSGQRTGWSPSSALMLVATAVLTL